MGSTDNGTIIGAIADGAVTVRIPTHHTANIISVTHNRAGGIAVLDSAAVVIAYHSTNVMVSDYAGIDHTHISDGTAAHIAEQSNIITPIKVGIQTADGVVLSVKGAGIVFIVIADG